MENSAKQITNVTELKEFNSRISSSEDLWSGFRVEHYLWSNVESPEVSYTTPIIGSCIDGEIIKKFEADNFKRKEITVDSGNMSIYPSGFQHIGIIPKNAEAMMVYLNTDFFETSFETSINFSSYDFVPQPALRDPVLKTFLEILLLESKSEKNSLGKIYGETIGLALAQHLLKNYSSKKYFIKDYHGGLSRYKFRKVKEFINENLSINLSLEEIAKTVNMSQFHFARLFKQTTGMPPHKYIIKTRIKKAKRLLEKTDLGIAEIAVKVGFSNQSHLSHHFRKATGVTPLKYRNSL